MDQVFQYRGAVAEATFLFESDVTDFLDAIDKRALRLWLAHEQWAAAPLGDEKARLAGVMGEELLWLNEQLPLLKPTFAPYMKFAIWRSGPFGQLVTVGRDAWTRIRRNLDG